MMDTEPSPPLCIRLPRSLSLQPRHVLGRYEPNHSLAKAATHPAPSSLPLPLHPSVFLVTVYAHPAASPRVTLPPPSLPPTLSCSDCEWSKHELSHTSSTARLGAAEDVMHPVDMHSGKNKNKKQASSARAAGRKSGRQVES